MSDEKPSKHEDSNDSVDRMEFQFPIGGGFRVSGTNASKLFWAVGVTAIIIAMGWAVANIIGAMRNGSATQLSILSGSVCSGEHETHLH